MNCKCEKKFFLIIFFSDGIAWVESGMQKNLSANGGSGGHVYPAIAIADKFREKDPDGEILYVGYLDGFEKRVVPKAGYKMAEIDTRWVDRSNIKELGLTAYHVGRGIIQARGC